MSDRKIIFAVILPLKVKLFRATVAYMTLEVWSLSIHYLIRFWTKRYPKFEPLRMVQNEHILSFLTKTEFFKTLFCQGSDNTLQDGSVVETIVECKLLIFRLLSFSVPNKNYGSPTRVTMLKVAPNMADATSMKHPVSILNNIIVTKTMPLQSLWLLSTLSLQLLISSFIQ